MDQTVVLTTFDDVVTLRGSTIVVLSSVRARVRRVPVCNWSTPCAAKC